MSNLHEKTVTLVGAGGKMGLRISYNLVKGDFQLYCVENAERNLPTLQQRNVNIVSLQESVPVSDYVILAVPDIYIKFVSEEVSKLVKDGAVVIILDPAAAYADQFIVKEGTTAIVAHPCHPSIFLERDHKEQYEDSFGGVSSPQDVVVAMHAGDSTKMAEAIELIRLMYSPVEQVHEVTVDQMALLEPTLVETVTCMIGTILKESLDEIVAKGVPEPAAKSMLLGHINIALAVTLKGANPFSDACKIAIDLGKRAIIKDDWKKVFEKDYLDYSIQKMLQLPNDAKERVQ